MTVMLYKIGTEITWEGLSLDTLTVFENEVDEHVAKGWARHPFDLVQPPQPVADIAPPNKEALLAEAKALGIDAKGTWGVERLQEAIANVKAG